MSRRTAALVLPVVLLVAAVVVAAVLPVPYVRLSPGPTYNTIGSYDGTPLITISGHRTYPTAGNLNMTTVSEAGGPVGRLTLGDALRGWVDPTVRVVPREQLYPDDAVAAALGHLKIPVTTLTVVASVSNGTPADGHLEPGDVLVSIQGTPIRTPADVGKAVRSHPVGTSLAIVVRRDSATKTVTVVSGPKPGAPATPYLGITAGVSYKAPFPITFALDDVGGPSAGTMFALGIVDKLTPGELNGGKFVAGTGTISPDGQVGPIGGIAQKMVGARDAGAVLFLAPASNCDEVVGHVPDGLTVTPMATLDQAVTRLGDYAAGKALPSCPAG